jgi:hypothetical protein
VTWRAHDLTGPIADTGNQVSQRIGLARAAAWLGRLRDRLAIEQTNALESVADSVDHDAWRSATRIPRAVLAPRTGLGAIAREGLER